MSAPALTLRAETEHCEQLGRIAPKVLHAPAASLRGEGEASGVELPARLRMDGLAFRKREAGPGCRHKLRPQAHEMHLDCEFALVPSGLVCEGVERKSAPKFPIDAGEKVEVEFRGDAPLVVVGGDQGVDVLAQVDSDNRLPARADVRAHPAKQGGGVGWAKIAKRRAGEKGCAGPGGNVGGNLEV